MTKMDLDANDMESLARIIAPLAWAALGRRDTLAQKSRRTASIRKAQEIMEAGWRAPEKSSR